MDRQLEIMVGVPVASALPGDERIRAGVLPAGRYATLIYTGDYEGLIDANAAIQAWGAEKGLAWQRSAAEKGEVWGGRIESYFTDPAEVPDPEKWETEVAYLVADD
jgi:effector-binding domain-containing protein